MVEIHLINIDSDLDSPVQATPGSSGFDLRARESVIIAAGEIVAVPTGLRMGIPRGYEGQVRPRSGLSLKGITVANAPGTIDSDYRGEVKVILINLGREPFHLEKGDRMAQLVIQKVESVTWRLVDELESTERGAGGFGSTGTS